MKEEEFQVWEERMCRVLSRIPRPAGSERFVQSIMVQIRHLEERVSEPFSMLARWLTPAFAVAAVCFVFSIIIPSADIVPTDSLLLPRSGEMSLSRDASSHGVLSDDPLALLERQ